MPEDIYVRLDGIKGECTEDLHPGDKGWIQIKSFSFGFGLKDSGAGGVTSTRIGGAKTDEERDRDRKIEQLLRKDKETEAAKRKGDSAAADDGAFDFRPAKLDKTLDLASTSLWSDHSHKGTRIPQIELVACRYGGSGTTSADIKIPFLRLVFEEVRVTDISLSLSDDDLPVESMEFDFYRVGIETLWTDNETGIRLINKPCRAGWDREHNIPWLAKLAT